MASVYQSCHRTVDYDKGEEILVSRNGETVVLEVETGEQAFVLDLAPQDATLLAHALRFFANKEDHIDS